MKGQGLGAKNNGIRIPIERPEGVLLEEEDPKCPRGFVPPPLSARLVLAASTNGRWDIYVKTRIPSISRRRTQRLGTVSGTSIRGGKQRSLLRPTRGTPSRVSPPHTSHEIFPLRIRLERPVGYIRQNSYPFNVTDKNAKIWDYLWWKRPGRN